MVDPKPRAFKSSLSSIATSYVLRCDAKQADPVVAKILAAVTSHPFFYLSELLPNPFVKGTQPVYLDQPTEDSVPVVNTLSIQRLSINRDACRHINREDFDAISEDRRLKRGDVVLTVDGGVSIGKPCLFDLDGDFSVDSHVVILRPRGVSPLALVYLLSSPLGQIQFQRAESGASGQTTVTEDDIRRFIFPRKLLGSIDSIASGLEARRQNIIYRRKLLDAEEQSLWEELDLA